MQYLLAIILFIIWYNYISLFRDLWNPFTVNVKIQSNMCFNDFKNFCMSNKARVKRYKKRGKK